MPDYIVPDVLPDALKRVPRTETQPRSQDMLSYAQVMNKLGQLSTLARVRVELVGTSQSGRPIPLIAITSFGGETGLDEIRAVAASLTSPAVLHTRIGASTVVRPLLSRPPTDYRLPVLFLSSNFGMEAAQVEALVQLAEFFASDESEATTIALDKLVILIVPFINPDGRELALAHWQTRPLSPAWPAQGNFFDIEVTREYLHLVEPETRALAQIVREWHPFLVWEVHEDGIGLGWGQPEVCLCPPISPFGRTGIDSPVAQTVNNPRIYAEHQRYGDSIAQVWAARGYRYLHDREGRHGWPRYPVAGYEEFVAQPETRFTQAMPLRGVTAFITESCRIPGSQTWEDRVNQKVSAGIAIAATASRSREPLVEAVSEVSRRALAGPEPSAEFFLLPQDQDPYSLGRAVDVLLCHDVRVYRTRERMAEPALVIPLSQPLRPTIELLLSIDRGRHQSLGAALGLRVRPSVALTEAERSEWLAQALDPLMEASSILPRSIGPLAAGAYYAVDNTHEGVRLVNRLLRLPGSDVRWNTSRLDRTGRFIFRALGSQGNAEDAARGLRIHLRESSEDDFNRAAQVRLPRIGLYAGQGCLENRFNGTLLRWFLTEWEFSFRLIGPAEIEPGTLRDLDFLAIPNGNAQVILDGKGPNTVWHRRPWDLDEDPVTISSESIDALRKWVADGGTYVGIDAGGGLLASNDFLGLLDARPSAWNLGTGLVELTLEKPDDPIFDGIRGSWGPDGAWRDAIVYAMYVSNPQVGLDGGCIFEPGPEATLLASYCRSLPVEGVPHIKLPEYFGTVAAKAAIVGSPLGTGYVAAFGIEPTYRCTFLNTARMISNLIYRSSWH